MTGYDFIHIQLYVEDHRDITNPVDNRFCTRRAKAQFFIDWHGVGRRVDADRLEIELVLLADDPRAAKQLPGCSVPVKRAIDKKQRDVVVGANLNHPDQGVLGFSDQDKMTCSGAFTERVGAR